MGQLPTETATNCAITGRESRTEAALDDNLPSAYDVDWYEQKCDRVYNHIYEKYYGAGQSVYAQAGMR